MPARTCYLCRLSLRLSSDLHRFADLRSAFRSVALQLESVRPYKCLAVVVVVAYCTVGPSSKAPAGQTEVCCCCKTAAAAAEARRSAEAYWPSCCRTRLCSGDICSCSSSACAIDRPIEAQSPPIVPALVVASPAQRSSATSYPRR